VAAVLRCAVPGALAGLHLCDGPGCLSVAAPPKPEWLEARTHAALLAVSRALGRRLDVRWAFRDPTLGRFLAGAAENLSCQPVVEAPATSPYTSGRAVDLAAAAGDEALAAALSGAGFTPLADGGWIYAEGADLRPSAIRSFQALWNVNRPDDPLAVDGALGPMTRDAVDRAPIGGFAEVPCPSDFPPVRPGGGQDRCVEGCFNQSCPGTYELCAAATGACQPVPCGVDDGCADLDACDDPARGSPPDFFCDDGRCRRAG